MRIESDMVKTASVIAVLVAAYGGLVFWPGQKQSKAMAEQVQTKQQELDQSVPPDLAPLREKIDALRSELRERSVALPSGDPHDRVLQHLSDTLLAFGVSEHDVAYNNTRYFKRFAAKPIEINFECGFIQAFEIIRRIENQGPPVRIEHVDISGDVDETSGQVWVSLKLSSFYLPTSEGGRR